MPWLLAAMMTGAAGSLVVQIVGGSDPRDALPINWIFLLTGPFAATGLSPFARGQLLSSLPAGHDEFEREALGRATVRAYVALLGLMLAAFGWWWWASLDDWPLPRTRSDWLGCVVALLVVATNLPAFLAELAVPFPVDQEEPDA